jgi:peroxiredoxin
MAYSFPPSPDTPQRASRSTSRSPLRNVLPRLIVLAVTLALLVGFFALVHATTSTTAPARSVSSTTRTDTTSASTTSRASPAPDFTLPLLSGTTFHLAAQQGHPVVLYFMATTCESCVQGSRDLAQTFLSAKIQGAEALAIDVNSGDRPADLQAFIQGVGINASAPIQWGIDTNDAIASAYGVQTLETTVVIDPHGQVAYRSDGSVPPEQLAQIVRKLA